MKKTALFLIIVFCLGLTACSKDAEVNAFIAENHAVIGEIVKKIDADPSEAGVDEAQKFFDTKKDGLKAKWDAIKNARSMQVSEDVVKKLDESLKADGKLLIDVQQKHAQKLASSGNAMNKFVNLVKAYEEIIKP